MNQMGCGNHVQFLSSRSKNSSAVVTCNKLQVSTWYIPLLKGGGPPNPYFQILSTLYTHETLHSFSHQKVDRKWAFWVNASAPLQISNVLYLLQADFYQVFL